MVKHLSEASILLKNATIQDPLSQHKGNTTDIFIQNGIISEIGKNLKHEAEYILDCSKLVVQPAFTDLRCHVDEPGNEHKETISSLCRTAASGGFSDLAGLPSTDPPVQNKSSVQFIIQRSSQEMVNIHPLGAATEDLKGNELTELYDLKTAGARGFSNGNKPYSKTNVLYKVLQYSKNFMAPVFSHAEDPHLAQDGMVNESGTTVHTGLKYRPSIAEFSRIQQEIEVARYADSPIHFSHISCIESVEVIRKAKKEGLAVSCDVSILHLCLTDEAVLDFDTNTKILPPLRTEADRQALIAGLKDGTIDAICSDHRAQNQENKLVEFDYASFGAITLQSFYSLTQSLTKDGLSADTIIEKSCHAPRQILGLETCSIEKGMPARIACFDPSETWTLDRSNNTSLSENSPYWGKELKGRCKALINSSKFYEL